MALNFPNPALQTPLNEFSPDSTPAKSTNGVTYVWTNNEKWVASSVVFNDIYVNVTGDTMTGQLELPGGGGDTQALQKQEVEALIDTSITAAPYVEVAGDNMTGDLTLGTDKITLNADGSASFAGNVSYNWDSTSNPGYIVIPNTGQFIAKSPANNSGGFSISKEGESDADVTWKVTGDGTIFANVDKNANTFNYKYLIKGDGNAQFAGDIQSTSQNGGQLAGFRNQLINGNFNIFQRGTSANISTSLGYYTADRWYVGGTNGSTNAIAPTGQSGANFPFTWQNTLSAAGQYRQRIELFRNGENVPFAPDSVWCLSFWSKQPVSEISVQFARFIAGAASAGSSVTSTALLAIDTQGAWTKYSSKLTIDQNATGADNSFEIGIGFTGASNLTGVQLEPGPVATPFEHRPYGTELALCQRYFYRYLPNGLSVQFQGTSNTNNPDMQPGTSCDWCSLLQYPVTMRATPTGSNYINLGGQNYVAIPGYRAVTATFNDSDFGFTRASNQCGQLTFKANLGSITAAQGTSYALEATFSYDLDAEL